MFFSLVFLLAMEIIGSGASLPEVKDFNVVLSKELEFRVDDYKTAFVGRVVDYQNPDDPNESVRVYYRQVAIVSERAKEKNSTESGGRDRNSTNLNYHLKRETEAIDRAQRAIDTFAYVQWRTVRDSRTGQDVKIGHFQIWLLDSSGVWAYHVQPADTKSLLEPSPFSEPSKTDPKKRIIVGIKFTLENTMHIVRIDQDNIVASVKEASDDKK